MNPTKIKMIRSAAQHGLGASPDTTIQLCNELEKVGVLPDTLERDLLFYGVGTVAELLAEQAKHITQLIGRLPADRAAEVIRAPREG